MKARLFSYLLWLLLFFIIAFYPRSSACYKAKIAVFSFTILNLDARGYDATVTNMLMSFLERNPSLNILNRKELEAFLSLNDLQQNRDFPNVIYIGDRLGLDMIIVGSVKKGGPVIEITCKIAKIAEKAFIFDKKLRSFGDAGLREEVRRLSLNVSKVIDSDMSKVTLPVTKEVILRAPINTVSRPGSSKVTLEWEDSTGSKPSGYKIFRGHSKGGPFIKVAQVTQARYVDKGLEKNTAYYYKIKAFDPKGRESDYSRIIHAETAMTPNPPIILSTEPHLKSNDITWSPNPIKSDDPSKLMGYKLYRAKTAEGPYREVTNLLSKDLGIGIDTTLYKLFKIHYLDKNLADGEEYYYRVSAYNEKNLESDLSSPMKGRCIPVIQGVTAKGDMIRQIKLSWNIATSEHVKGYFIYRSTSRKGGFIKIEKVVYRKTHDFLDTKGLKDKTTYYYRFSLFEDKEKEGAMSDVVFATTKGPPPIPQGLKARSGIAKQVELTWKVSPEEEIKGYKLYRSMERQGEYIAIGKIGSREKNTYLDKGTYNKPLTDNTTYYYKLTSYNKVDVESRATEVVSATTKQRPARPSGFGGESLHVKEIPLFWQKNPENDIIKYHIFRCSGRDEEFSEVGSVKGDHFFIDRGLKDGSEYTYKIKAEDRDHLLSDFSDTITLRTKPKPRAPEGLTAVLEEETVILTWSANTEPDIVSYSVFERGFFGLTKIGTVKEPRVIVAVPKSGKSKDYLVTAVDLDNLESEPSQPVTVFWK